MCHSAATARAVAGQDTAQQAPPELRKRRVRQSQGPLDGIRASGVQKPGAKGQGKATPFCTGVAEHVVRLACLDGPSPR